MAEKTIRQDVIELSIKSDTKSLKGLLGELEKVKKAVYGVGESDDLDDLKNQAKKAKTEVGDLGDQAKKTKKQFDNLGGSLSAVGKKASGVAFTGLKKIAGISFKSLTVGIAGAATATGLLVKNAVSAYASYEQLVGGVDTLFKNNSKTVQKYANDAYKTAGLSANAYMETVTSFSAAMINSVGGDTAKAAKLSDMAITDMSDNSSKLGTSMDSIIQTYQSLARGNFAMLDNLKLGYGGTKEELKRLLKDAQKLTGKKYDISNFSDVVEAIHAVQDKMGITGTTAKEASSTISGSLSSMKASWQNLLPALIQGGDAFDQCVDNLLDSAKTFFKNIKPAIIKALSGIGDLITELAPIIEKEFPVLVDELLPPLIKAATALLKGLIIALPNIAKVIIDEIPDILKGVGEAIADAFGINLGFLNKFGDFFEQNGDKIKKFTPILLGLVGAFMLFNKLKGIGSIFSGLFGKGGKTGGSGAFDGLTNAFKSLAKTKSGVILKGIANLSIIIGGVTGIAAALMLVAPYIANLSGGKSMVELIAVIGAVGLVGGALSKVAAIVGKIPVATVAKGLANIAIIMGGTGVLTLLLGAITKIMESFSISTGQILKLTLVIGAVGGIGSVLAILAGIVGCIPFPVVLAGLANIAIAIGGVTAIIAAFGALAKIPGFNEFITSGGEALANIFNILGKCVGSIIGGLGEGLTNSLPKIGANLSMFALSLQPLFTTFGGADMSGIGTFFKSLGAFIAVIAGEKILSFFTGGTNFAELGTELNTFAKNAKGFFTEVAAFPENGFANATRLFDCLAGMKSLPKEGGVVGWFSGGINYENIANGLHQLSGAKVTGFFNAVGELAQTGFDNATKLFECLADLKSLPKDGGVVGWFSGSVDYSKIAAGLGHLSGQGVANFFSMVSKLDQKAFDNTTALFKSLSNMGELPKEGGWWDKLTGDETTTLSNLAKELSNFSSKAETFFSQVNGLNLGNLNGLWESLKNSEDVSANTLKAVSDDIAAIVEKVKQLPVQMGDGIRNAGNSLKDSLVYIWQEAAKAIASPVNKIIEGANWILKQFNSDSVIAAWTPYAKGTDGHKGGNALVNDGRGAELVQMPNGNAFIPQGRNVFMPNAPKGMKVLPAEQTAALLGKRNPAYRYAKGTGDIDIWSYIDNAKGLISAVSNKYVNFSGMSGFALNAGKGMVTTVANTMSNWVTKLFDEFGAKSIADYVASAGVEQWKSTVIRALQMEGQYTAANVKRTLFQMQTESGGNPKAINLWDSNAKKGIPSKGLMQVIDPTFKAYARAGFDKNIYDPLSNILASIRYALSRYGSLAKAYRGVGYANGGFANKPSIFGEDGLEAAIPLERDKRKQGLSLWAKTGDMLGVSSYLPETSGTHTTQSNEENVTYAPTFNITINGSLTDRATVRQTKQQIFEIFNEYFENLERKNKTLRQV